MIVAIMSKTRCPTCVFTATRRPQREATERTSKVSFTTHWRSLYGCISLKEFFHFLFSSEKHKAVVSASFLFELIYVCFNQDNDI